MSETTRNIGQDAEDACCSYLQEQGLSLIEQNYQCRLGEIDLIMKEGSTIIFVEVRYRKNNHFIGALESITPSKQKKVRATAHIYLQAKSLSSNARIDVVGMSQDSASASGYAFEWIKNAF